MSRKRFVPALLRSVALVAACMVGITSVRAVGITNKVLYAPSLITLQGVLPFTVASGQPNSYTLTVTAPNNLPVGTTTVTLGASVNAAPLVGGLPIADAIALGFLRFSAPTLTFTKTSTTAPDPVASVVVTVEIPLGSVAGAYGYQITTTGWPTTIAFENLGASVNATTTFVAQPNPPSVAIATPVDGYHYVVPYTNPVATINYSFSATSGQTDPVVTSVTSSLDGADFTSALSVADINSRNVTGSRAFTITATAASRKYTLTATASNSVGTSTDNNEFWIDVTAPAPTVTIDTPAAGTTYNYVAGGAPVSVPFQFTAKSNFGGVRTLVAKVDGITVAYSPSTVGNLTETRTVNLPYTTAGTHTLSVTMTDDYGTATANSNFTVTVSAPTPTVDITRPLDNEVFTLPTGATTMNVPFRFASTSNNGFVVNSVSASLGTTSVAIATTTGLTTPSAVSEGTIPNLAAGTYTLTAYATSAGITVSDFVTFTVKANLPPPTQPPTVVINTPPVGSTYTRVSGGPALSIPLTFTGTSQTTGGVITQLKASLGSTPLAVTATNLNTKIATGAATISVSNAGTYTINVTAIDAYGTASASRNFTVCVVQGRSICGDTFFDVDFDGQKDCSEFGLAGITVKLLDSTGAVIGTDVTDNCGNYSFSNVGPGSYRVVAAPYTGLRATTVGERAVTVGSSNVCVPDFGFGLNFDALRTMTANGFTIGYWKNNIDKALDNKTSGTQVTKATLLCYTDKIGDFALAPFDCLTMKSASSAMGYNGSNSISLLTKQLAASEYNYQNGAYLNGNKNLTFLFLYWGEYIVVNQNSYASSYELWAKDWFDAYNNSHGGLVAGPR